MHVSNPSTWEVDTGQSRIQHHLQLPSEFEASLGYMNPIFKDSIQPEVCFFVIANDHYLGWLTF